MAKKQTPDFIHNPPELPLPWRPSERARIKRSIIMNKDNRSEGTLDYLQEIDSRYIITDIGVQAVEMAVGYTSVGARVFYGEHMFDMAAEDMQRQFEQEVLGLEPLPRGNGLRHNELRSGFGGGTYPIEPLADFVGIDSQDLNEVLHDDKLTKFGHVILRNADYIVPVKKDSHGNNLFVSADKAMKLSERGKALVDTALSIADYSTRS